MSANLTPPVQGTHAPAPLELFWERYRSIIYVVVFAAIAALGINYGVQKYQRDQRDAEWSKFSASVGLKEAYGDADANGALLDDLAEIEIPALRQAMDGAPDAQKPFLMLAIARKAMLAKDWDTAEASLRELETRFPNHSLVKTTPHPVQALDPVPLDPAAPPTNKPRTMEWKPAVAGSAVSLMRAQIETAKTFTTPTEFAPVEVPADAPKVKFELGETGSFTVAWMPQASLHREAILNLARAEPPFWQGIAIDEVRRPTKGMQQPRELHFGFESTRKGVEEWTDTEPSKNTIEFEKNSLSHFPGAVSARIEKDGKSAPDRLWITLDDAPRYDGDRVVVGFVVEGLDVLRQITEAPMMTTQQEEQGRGRPSEPVRITSVTVLP